MIAAPIRPVLEARTEQLIAQGMSLAEARIEAVHRLGGMALLGVAIGLVIVLWAGRFIAPLLFETSPRDVGVLLGGAGTLLAVSILASAVPALRAKRVNPIEALRSD